LYPGGVRLPGIARAAWALFGRAQRFINDVQAEVAREIELEHEDRVRVGGESFRP
jgi:sec-independent protein translocase protein TatB